jgi:hypothetical protein
MTRSQNASTILSRFAILALLFAACPLHAHADEIPADEAKDIRTLLHVSGGDSLGLQMGTYMANSIIDAVRRQMPDLADSKVNAIKQVIGDVLREEMPHLLDQVAPLGEEWGKSLQPKLQKRLEKALGDAPGNSN